MLYSFLYNQCVFFEGQAPTRVLPHSRRQHPSRLDRLEDLRTENLSKIFVESESRVETSHRGSEIEHVRTTTSKRTRLQIEVKTL